jgi:hypothetical protein
MPGPDAYPPLAALVVEHEAEYVVGFPAYVAFALRAAKQGAAVHYLPIESWRGARDAIGLRVRRGEHVVEKDEPDGADMTNQDGTKGLKVPMGGETRVVVDLAERFAHIPPGSYRVEVGYGTKKRHAWSAAFPLVLRKPDEEETKDLALYRASGAKGWVAWTESPAGPVTPPRGKRDPLRLNKTLRYVYFGPELDALDLSVLDALDGMWAPERDALRAEILALRDPARAEKLAGDVAAKHPGLWEEMKSVAGGIGPVKYFRAQRLAR